ncbi:AcrR family transcriptional regulator [Ochrobactrum sp. AN78]|nr:AcrR family transcriptional regulator [Ochrobactrum sp. AN78]
MYIALAKPVLSGKNSTMEQVTTSDAGWRGSPDLWLQAAYDALIENGVDAVRILPLAKTLDISRTSFYWFFKDREELLDALIARWRDKNTGALLRQTDAYAETIEEAVLNVFDCWLNRDLFDTAFEFAIRSWALQSVHVEEEVREADASRLEGLTRMFERFGFDKAIADVRARTIYLVQIGFISMRTQEETEVRLARIPHYVEAFTGQTPQQRELDRFLSRHSSNRY